MFLREFVRWQKMFIQFLDIREYLRPAEPPVFFQCAFHLVDGERFEQIVHSVDPEGMDGVLVVGGREGRAPRRRPPEYLENRTVGPDGSMKNQIRDGVLFQPCDALCALSVVPAIRMSGPIPRGCFSGRRGHISSSMIQCPHRMLYVHLDHRQNTRSPVTSPLGFLDAYFLTQQQPVPVAQVGQPDAVRFGRRIELRIDRIGDHQFVVCR